MTPKCESKQSDFTLTFDDYSQMRVLRYKVKGFWTTCQIRINVRRNDGEFNVIQLVRSAGGGHGEGDIVAQERAFANALLHAADLAERLRVDPNYVPDGAVKKGQFENDH